MRVKHKYLVNDPHNGRDRYYVRKTGYPKVRLKSTFNSPAFWLEYNNALQKLNAEQPKVESQYKHGMLGWLFDQYQQSPEFQNLAKSTKKERFLIYGRICRAYGKLYIHDLTPLDFYALRDGQADTPTMANKFIRCCKYAFKWGIQRTLIVNDPVSNVEYIRFDTDGFVQWTTEDVLLYVKKYPIGTKQFLAFIIAATINGRRADIVRIGPQHRNGNKIQYTQDKRKSKIDVDFSPFLQSAIEATPTGDFTYIIRDDGKPYSKEGFGNMFKRWLVAAKIDVKGKNTHGIRKAFASWCSEYGVSDEQLMAGFGWRDRKQVTTYTKGANRSKLSEPISEAIHDKLSHLLGSETISQGQVIDIKHKK